MRKCRCMLQILSLTVLISLSVSGTAVFGAEPSSGAADTGAGTAADASAAQNTASAPAKKKLTGKWYSRNGYWYCKRKGRKLKGGIFEVDGKKYLFDRKGRQLTGWRKVGRYKYYFRCAKGKKGYMLAGQKADGIRLKKSGRAAPKGKRAKQKLPLLLEVQKLVDRIVTPEMSKAEKLKACYRYLLQNYHNYVVPEMGHTKGNWDIAYAAFLLDHNCGDCISFAAAFAYCAGAVGYKNVRCVNDGSHCWTEVNGKFYDPHWEKCLHIDCYAIPSSMSGRGGRPDWAAHRTFIRNCDK